MAPPSAIHREKETIAEQFYSQVSDSIKSVFDLTSRIDERVKMLVERQNDVEERLDKFLEIQQTLSNRISIIETKDVSMVKTEVNVVRNDVADLSKKVAIIESQDYQIEELKIKVRELNTKLELLEIKSEGHGFNVQHNEKRWATIFDFVFKLSFILLGGWLLYKLGLQSPPTP